MSQCCMQVAKMIIWSLSLTITPLDQGRKTVPRGFGEDLATWLGRKCLAMAFSFGGNEK